MTFTFSDQRFDFEQRLGHQVTHDRVSLFSPRHLRCDTLIEAAKHSSYNCIWYHERTIAPILTEPLAQIDIYRVKDVNIQVALHSGNILK